MLLFGFEVDTLEIALREQIELVDKVFIVESSLTHKGVSGAVWQGDCILLSWEQTFAKFHSHREGPF